MHINIHLLIIKTDKKNLIEAGTIRLWRIIAELQTLGGEDKS